MTGFGRAQVELDDKKLTVEIKSLNGKQMDLSTRIPSLLREKELEVRSYLTGRLMRGKVDLLIYAEAADADNSHDINAATVASYREKLQAIEPSLSPTDSLAIAMRLPDVFRGEREELSEEAWQTVQGAIRQAADALVAYRESEGAVLHRELASYIGNIRALAAQVEPFEKSRVEQIKERLRKHLSEAEVKVDENRFEQEIIFYLEKLDITEEKVRLNLHLDYFLKTMDSEENCGKKLGFIAQEIGREINTMGSKSNQADMQKLVVRMKDELEKIKEQSLNVL
ncbi:MAG TPA: YicC family protein [Candidatus Merdimorpha stercoravium]|uniref:YicC family protein n=1 Tax=Candidatus Merdimorpha stercoravium TaxID=2840863 RepID=A0A9D1H8T2_9FLAO|nr:YicC family protein [Candidatus Merdimorpha stercoravium]